MKARVPKWGGRRRARYVTPDLSYYWEGAREWCEGIKWDKEKNILQRYLITTTHSTSILL